MTGFVLGLLTGLTIAGIGAGLGGFFYGCRITEDSYTARAQGDPAASLARDTWTGALDTWEPAKPGDTPGELTPHLHPLVGAEPALQVRVGVTGRSLAPRTSGNAAPTTQVTAPPRAGAPAGSLLQQLDDEPDREKYPHWPWTVLPLEPGLGEHDEQEPEHEAIVEPVRTVLLVEAPRGPRHAKPDPLTDSDVRAIWPELVALLNTAGVDVDPLALPCTHCTDDEHGDCPGCACGCKLQAVAL